MATKSRATGKQAAKSTRKNARVEALQTDKDYVDRVIKQRRLVAQRQAQFRAELRRVFVENLDRQRNLARLADKKFDGFLAMLSAVPVEQRNLPGSRYVPRGASVLTANRAIIRSGIKSRINQAAVAGIAALDDEQAAMFTDAKGRFLAEIPAAALEPLLRPKQAGRSPGLIRALAPWLLCREDPVDPCIEILEGKEPAPPPDNPPEVEPVIPLKADVPLLIENLVKQMTPPESATIFSVDTRAGIEQVQQGVNSFTLHSGPADAPALHDFHHLQIAFEHVWQELFDEGVIENGKELYSQLVELGIDPNVYLIDPDEVKINLGTLKTQINNASQPALSEPPSVVIREFDITDQQFSVLSIEHQTELQTIALAIDTQRNSRDSAIADLNKLTALFMPVGFLPADLFNAAKDAVRMRYDPQIREERRRGEQIVRYADHKLEAPQEWMNFHPILDELEKSLKQPHRFSVYAANRFERSVNFGVVATYRQKWEPVSYQVGRLLKTVPLAPKEVRRFSQKIAVRKNRAEKEVENNLRSRKTESLETARAETQIVQKALNKTNFQMSAQGGVNVGIANASGKTAFGQDAATESQEVKKEFREAVFKAAEEYKQERTTEISVSTAEDVSFEESGEISNPNDEIPVTYLFYELQRRHKVSEQIHRVTPVVLVAQEFPKPNQIDEDWIIAHDWILRRVILDDSFTPAMNYLSTKVVGDEFSLKEMYENLQLYRRITEERKDELVAIERQVGRRYAALQKSIERRADAVDAEEGEGFLEEGAEFMFGSGDTSPEGIRVREDAARDAYERAAKEEKQMQARLERETTALNALTETYTKNLSDHLNRKAQIARLLVHIKSNIMYYMQAIWSHEPTDQRFFRLHEVQVPKLKGKTTYKLEADPDSIPMPPHWKKPLKVVAKCELDPDDIEFETLEQVADLDNLLGFKGNYMMFPMKQSNVLTDFMMLPYLDAVMGIRDPDPLGNWTLTDFLKYVCCLHRTLSKEQFDKRLPGMQAAYQQLVNAPGTDGEEIIVPTESLFVEALPGVHPILEDFKLYHRVLDVKKVQADVRAIEFENVRAAARLLAGEREDPTIEKKVVIEGGSSVIVSPDDN